MSAKEIAKMLLEIKAVMINVEKPFHYTSGMISPIYTDNRLIISYPEKRRTVIDAFLTLIQKKQLDFDVVAGTATAGIPHAAWVADRLNKPMVYVRGKAKGHGKQNQIEGALTKGQKCLVVEDLISTGKSSVDAAQALREAGGTVTDCVAIFSYLLPDALQKFSDAKVQCHTLTDFPTLITVAKEIGYLSESAADLASEWNKKPHDWCV